MTYRKRYIHHIKSDINLLKEVGFITEDEQIHFLIDPIGYQYFFNPEKVSNYIEKLTGKVNRTGKEDLCSLLEKFGILASMVIFEVLSSDDRVASIIIYRIYTADPEGSYDFVKTEIKEKCRDYFDGIDLKGYKL